MWYASYNIICAFNFAQTYIYIYSYANPAGATALPYTLDSTPLDVNVCSAGSVYLVRVNKHYVQVRRVSIEGEIIAPINLAALLLHVLQGQCSTTWWRQSASKARPGL